MNPNDVRKQIHVIVDSGFTPGQAFDAILALRSAKVTYSNIVTALSIDQPTVAPPPATAEQDLSKLDTDLEYNDDTPMPFGKWKGERLSDVPVGYFHWLWGERPMHDRRLEAYVQRNIPAFKIEDPDLVWK